MTPPLHVIDAPAPGRLATMAHPRGGALLPGEMAALAGAGVRLLVSALTSAEYRRLALAAEPREAHAAGLEFVSFPIPDRRTPAPGIACDILVDRLAGSLRRGEFVVIHCWAGIGRSSLLAAATLVRLGLTPPEAWRRISEARGLLVPGNDGQVDWLDEFACAAQRA
ncbi:protein-tyrosine phosphatase family protein [Rhizomonospora bruguierae]|uniref:protein-tyrosine phosphatase family protein n=1 Tax=Rhizomonospora bruguierae TaxID=1581705 RepID=UPI001BCABDD5|nr:dual specificity protein phosphatase family protein [Micromonospora sp. NBRC 107566]